MPFKGLPFFPWDDVANLNLNTIHDLIKKDVSKSNYKSQSNEVGHLHMHDIIWKMLMLNSFSEFCVWLLNCHGIHHLQLRYCSAVSQSKEQEMSGNTVWNSLKVNMLVLQDSVDHCSLFRPSVMGV